MELEAPTSVTMTPYTPISANLIATEPGNGGEANGNCVVVRRGGKQPGAKEQSQTQVNPIRCVSAASLLVNGEACAERNLSVWHPPVNAQSRAGMYGWGGNVSKEVCVSGESCMSRYWPFQPIYAAVRAFIVAEKSGNSDGAKGGRKANASSECQDEENSALVSSHSSNKPAEEVLRKYGKSKRRNCSTKLPRTFARRVKAVNLKACIAEPLESGLKTLKGEATGLCSGVKRQPESPDLSGEIRTSGSEGGVRLDPSFLPLSLWTRSLTIKVTNSSVWRGNVDASARAIVASFVHIAYVYVYVTIPVKIPHASCSSIAYVGLLMR